MAGRKAECITDDGELDRKNAGGAAEPAPPQARDGARLELYDWVQCIVAALVIGILIFMFVARVVSVDGSSMYPTLCDRDKIITSDLFYTPKDGDVIVLQTDTYGKDPLVKRIIATGGETVNIDFTAGVVYVNGEALDEPYVNALTHEQEDFSGPLTVPEGYLFVMGDNRNASTDSRSRMVGLVDARCVIGKVFLVLIPSEGTARASRLSRIGSIYG